MDPNLVHGALALVPKPGNMDAVIAQAASFAKLVEEKEPGVLMFSIARSKPIDKPDSPEEVVVAVTFKDKETAEGHMVTEHRVKFIEEAIKADLCVGPPEIRALTMVGGFPPRKAH